MNVFAKKLFLIIATILGVGCFTARAGLFDSKIDQSTKEKAEASLLRALVAEDILAIYQLTDPTVRKTLISKAGGILSARRKLNEKIKPAKAEILNSITEKFGTQVDPEEFAIGIIDEDIDQVWDAYSSESQKKLIASAGSEEAARKRLEPLIGYFKKILLLEADKKIGKHLVKRNNKWYFHPPEKSTQSPKL